MSLRTATRKAFREPARQGCADLIILHGHAQQANSPLETFGNALAREISGKFVLANNKDYDESENKANGQFGGDVTRLTDLARGTVYVKTIAEIEALNRLMDSDNPSRFIEAWSGKGYIVHEHNSTYGNPTDTGFQGTSTKVRLPLTKGRSHVGEIQGQLEGMKDYLEETHKIYELIRSIRREFKNAVLPSKEAAHINNLKALTRDIHVQGYAANGLKID